MATILTRTKLATAAAVVAIAVSAAVAVGANVGILDTAADNATGELSAAGDLTGPTGPALDGGNAPAALATVAPSSTIAPSGTQAFTVDEAGVISVEGTPDAIRLDAVRPAPGWRWTMTQTDAATLSATFTNGARTLQFDASADAGGTIAASVIEPVPVPVPGSGAAPSGRPSATSVDGSRAGATPSSSFGADDDDEDDDEHDRYEGSDDDD